MSEKAHLILASLVAFSWGCVDIGSLDGSFLLPDYDDPGYPDALAHDADAIDLEADPDGYSSGGNDFPYAERRYRLGPPNIGQAERGGQTILIEGTGLPVCVVVDPEDNGDGDTCDYNDGDIDLSIGRLSDYTGEPGTSLGGFAATWTDDLGIVHTTDNNLCNLGSTPTDPAGRGSPEYCAFETEVGQQYIVVAETFSVPVDDNIINFAVLVQPGHRGTPQCVFTDQYFKSSPEALDESDASFRDDNPYADYRDPCYCPANDAERAECEE